MTMVVDAERLLCPMPLIETQKALQGLAVGEQLILIASDPGTLYDIPTWCRQNGHAVLAAEERDKKFYFTIRKMQEDEVVTPKKW
jgi:tRNA 2-thiouridine synthesizing protein A